MRKADYSFKMNEFCCHGALFLWQLQHFMNTGCLSNKVAMVTFTRFLLRITANLIDKIWYYVSHMNELSLNDSKKMWFLTLFKHVLLEHIAECCKGPFCQPGAHMLKNWKILTAKKKKAIELAHEIVALFVLRKLILQTCMRSQLVG